MVDIQDRVSAEELKELVMDYGNTMLCLRVGFTSTFLALFLLLSACGNGNIESNETAMLKAAELGDRATLESLLQNKAQPDVRDICQWTPLMKAALNGHSEIVRQLLDAGAVVDLADKGGYTALMFAASNNHGNIVQLLISRGADVDRAEKTLGWTALIWSAKQGHLETVDVLVNNRADLTIRDSQGLTARDWAEREKYMEVMARLSE